MEAVRALLAAAFTVALAVGAGSLLLRRLRLEMDRLEHAMLSFLCGSALVASAVFALCAVQQARRGAFQWIGAAVIVWAAATCRRNRFSKAPGGLSRIQQALCLSWIAAYFLIYLFIALAPEVSPDGAGYHLGNVGMYWRDLGFVWDHPNMYSAMPQGMEMLFLVAFTLGGHSAAALIHLAFQAVLPVLIYCYGRRTGNPLVGVFAAALVYVAPVVGIDGASAYNDVAVATLLFAVFFCIEVWDKERQSKWLLVSGLLAGFAASLKYTAALGIPAAAVLIAWRLYRGADRREAETSFRRAALLFGAPVALTFGPWLLRNWIWIGNPLAPFFNNFFPNPLFHPGMEEQYLQGLRTWHFRLNQFWPIVTQIILKGGAGFAPIGPAFLLIPVGLLAARRCGGRTLLAAAAICAMPLYFNHDTRFLIPALPFLALAVGLSVPRRILPLVIVLQGVACWPSVLARYADHWNWRIREIPLKAALRIEPELAFLKRKAPETALAPLLDRNTPERALVFTVTGKPAAYLDRRLVVGYESAFGTVVYDALTAATGDHLPDRVQTFRFFPVETRGVRIVQTHRSDAYWSVAELRVFNGGRELKRDPRWLLRAIPNPWDVQLAFDNNYATRWCTWRRMSRGETIEIQFGRRMLVDEVRIEGANAPGGRLRLDVQGPDGEWVPLSDTPEIRKVDMPPGLRRAGTYEVKAHGLEYLLLGETDALYQDIRKFPGYWDLVEIDSVGGQHLYHIR